MDIEHWIEVTIEENDWLYSKWTLDSNNDWREWLLLTSYATTILKWFLQILLMFLFPKVCHSAGCYCDSTNCCCSGWLFDQCMSFKGNNIRHPGFNDSVLRSQWHHISRDNWLDSIEGKLWVSTSVHQSFQVLKLCSTTTIKWFLMLSAKS